MDHNDYWNFWKEIKAASSFAWNWHGRLFNMSLPMCLQFQNGYRSNPQEVKLVLLFLSLYDYFTMHLISNLMFFVQVTSFLLALRCLSHWKVHPDVVKILTIRLHFMMIRVFLWWMLVVLPLPYNTMGTWEANENILGFNYIRIKLLIISLCCVGVLHV